MKKEIEKLLSELRKVGISTQEIEWVENQVRLIALLAQREQLVKDHEEAIKILNHSFEKTQNN
jgi:hypothetical protein